MSHLRQRLGLGETEQTDLLQWARGDIETTEESGQTCSVVVTHVVPSCAWSLTWSLTWEQIVVTDTQTAKQSVVGLYLGCLKKRLKLQVGFTEIIFVVVGTQVKVEFKETVAYFDI